MNRFTATGAMRITARIVSLTLILLVSSLLGTRDGWANLQHAQCVSLDNTLYFLLSADTSSVAFQLTSVVMSSETASACAEISSDDVLTAVSGGSGSLLPNQKRTTVIAGLNSNNVGCNNGSGYSFDGAAAGGAGILTVPLPGGGTKRISANPTHADCLTAPPCEAMVAVTTADGAVPTYPVPAGAFKTDVFRSGNGLGSCQVGSMSTPAKNLVFPIPGPSVVESDPVDPTAETTNQSVTFDETVGTRMGNPTSQPTVPDGIKLQSTCGGAPNASTCQIIVFTATMGASGSAGVAAAGFSTDNAFNFLGNTDGFGTNVTFFPPSPSPTPRIPVAPAMSQGNQLFTVFGLLLAGLWCLHRLSRRIDAPRAPSER